jgi:hypothetical protein
MERLAVYEEAARYILPDHQDHVIHSVNVFLLGLHLYYYDLNEPGTEAKHKSTALTMYLREGAHRLRFHAKKYSFSQIMDATPRDSENRKGFPPDQYSTTSKEFIERWKICVLFHDWSYPFELTGKFINDSFVDIFYDRETGFEQQPIRFERGYTAERELWALPYSEKYADMLLPFMEKGDDVFTLMGRMLHQTLLPDVNPEDAGNYLHECFKYGFDHGRIEHGILSAALLMRKAYGLMLETLEKGSREQNFALIPRAAQILDASTAIALHNIQYFPIKTLKNLKLCASQNPLAFMLKLCDELQLWWRFTGNDFIDAFNKKPGLPPKIPDDKDFKKFIANLSGNTINNDCSEKDIIEYYISKIHISFNMADISLNAAAGILKSKIKKSSKVKYHRECNIFIPEIFKPQSKSIQGIFDENMAIRFHFIKTNKKGMREINDCTEKAIKQMGKAKTRKEGVRQAILRYTWLRENENRNPLDFVEDFKAGELPSPLPMLERNRCFSIGVKDGCKSMKDGKLIIRKNCRKHEKIEKTIITVESDDLIKLNDKKELIESRLLLNCISGMTYEQGSVKLVIQNKANKSAEPETMMLNTMLLNVMNEYHKNYDREGMQ